VIVRRSIVTLEEKIMAEFENDEMMTQPFDPAPEVRARVREAYARLAGELGPDGGVGGCGMVNGAGCTAGAAYAEADLAAVPEGAKAIALGSGNPVEFANLTAGQTVLDLGSGGGLDCLVAAQIVGPSGRVIGVDMTPEMLHRAESNKDEMGASNVEFRLGELEHLPVEDESVDVVLSNCSINLSPDKHQVFREAYRVLKPGGTLVISDMMLDGPLPAELTEGPQDWMAVLTSLTQEKDYVAALEQSGFEDVNVNRTYPETVINGTELTHARDGSVSGARARAVVRVAETGETLRVVDLNPAADGASTRSFSGLVRARKCAVS